MKTMENRANEIAEAYAEKADLPCDLADAIGLLASQFDAIATSSSLRKLANLLEDIAWELDGMEKNVEDDDDKAGEIIADIHANLIAKHSRMVGRA